MATAHAQTSYPTKPIRFLVGYAPGGISDSNARMFAQRMSQRLGQQIIVENRLGAGGRIAATAVAKSPPDGYTLLFTVSGTHSAAPAIRKDLPYDPIKDFTPISLIGTYGFLLVTNPSLPATNVAELIALAKRNPGQLNYSSSGAGSGVHLAAEFFKLMAGVDIVHVPFSGAAPALQEVMAGRVEMTFDTGASVAVDAGRVRLIGTTSATRDPRYPMVPTIAEQGLKGYDNQSWLALYGPPGLPAAIQTHLNTIVNELLNDPEIRKRLAIWGVTVTPGPPSQLENLVRTEIAQFQRIVADAKLHFD